MHCELASAARDHCAVEMREAVDLCAEGLTARIVAGLGWVASRLCVELLEATRFPDAINEGTV